MLVARLRRGPDAPDRIAGRTAVAADGRPAEMTVQVCPPRPPAIGAGSVAGHVPARRQLDRADMPPSLARTHGRHRWACEESPRYRRRPCIFASRRAWDARNGGRPSKRGTDDDAWPREMLPVHGGTPSGTRGRHASRPGPVRNRALRRYRLATSRRRPGGRTRAEATEPADAGGRSEPARARSAPGYQLPGNGSTMNRRSFNPGAAMCPAKRGSRRGRPFSRYTER